MTLGGDGSGVNFGVWLQSLFYGRLDDFKLTVVGYSMWNSFMLTNSMIILHVLTKLYSELIFFAIELRNVALSHFNM